MTTKTEYRPRRKTTDVTLIGEDWHPVRQWIIKCRNIAPKQTPPFLFVDSDEEQAALEQFLRRTARLKHTDDVRLRMPHRQLEEFGDLFRFWEGCQDELRPEFRACAPNSGYFQSIALEIEAALRETFTSPRPEPEPARCQHCGKKIPGDGVAEVEVDGSARFWCRDHRDHRTAA